MDKSIIQTFENEIKNGTDPSSGLKVLIDKLSELYPNEIWDKIRKSDFEKETKYLESWLQRLLNYYPPKKIITQLWFGLYHPYTASNRLSTDAFIEGREKEEQPKTKEAQANGSFYWPRDRYSESKLINKIERLFTKKVKEELTEIYPNFIQQFYLSLFIQWFAKKHPQLLLGDSLERLLFMQYESEVIKLGKVSEEGFISDLNFNYWAI